MKKALLTLVFVGAIIISFMCGKVAQTTNNQELPENYIDTESDEFFNNYIDMREVVDFEATETGVMLYTNDGSGYYWER